MIFDTLEHFETYQSLHPHFADAMAFLRKLLAENAPDGKHALPGFENEIWVGISSYSPKALGETRMEAHEKYIDIQVMLDGEEYLYVPSEEGLAVLQTYDAEKDCGFYVMPAETAAVRLFMPKGYFTVFFAGELHAPGVAAPTSKTVRKAVIKILK